MIILTRTTTELRELVEQIQYKDNFRFDAYNNMNGKVTVEISFDRPDTFTGVMGVGHVTREDISHEIETGALYQLIFGMLLGLEEHECREAFKVQGLRPFGPHMNFDALLEAARASERATATA